MNKFYKNHLKISKLDNFFNVKFHFFHIWSTFFQKVLVLLTIINCLMFSDISVIRGIYPPLFRRGEGKNWKIHTWSSPCKTKLEKTKVWGCRIFSKFNQTQFYRRIPSIFIFLFFLKSAKMCLMNWSGSVGWVTKANWKKKIVNAAWCENWR